VNINELHKAIHVTRDDFDIITDYGKHLGPTAEFDKEQFREMMNGELWRYSRRQLDNVLALTGDDQFLSTLLMLKIFEAQTRKDMRIIKDQSTAILQHLGIARTMSSCGTPLPLPHHPPPSAPFPSSAAGAGAAVPPFASIAAGEDPQQILAQCIETVRSVAVKIDAYTARTDARFHEVAKDVAAVQSLLHAGPRLSSSSAAAQPRSGKRDSTLSADLVLVKAGDEGEQWQVAATKSRHGGARNSGQDKASFLAELSKARSSTGVFSLSQHTNRTNGSNRPNGSLAPAPQTQEASPRLPLSNLWASIYGD